MAADAGDFVKAVDRGEVDRRLLGPAVGGGRWWGLGGGDVANEFLGTSVKPIDLLCEVVDLAEQDIGELGVMLIEAAGECLDQSGVLDAQSSFGEVGEGVGDYVRR